MFVNYEWYAAHGYYALDDDDFKYLSQAERQINTLCYNRIANGTINKYMNTTQHIVKSIICEHADFLKNNNNEYENGVIKSYSNGGASYTFDNSKSSISNIKGIFIKNDLYRELVQTGLCYRGI